MREGQRREVKARERGEKDRNEWRMTLIRGEG